MDRIEARISGRSATVSPFVIKRMMAAENITSSVPSKATETTGAEWRAKNCRICPALRPSAVSQWAAWRSRLRCRKPSRNPLRASASAKSGI